MRNCWTATSYAEYHRNGCTHAAYSPGCRPLGSHSRLATTPSTMPRRLHRYKTLPARAPGGRYRYKTLPARSPVGPPGTKLSQHARKRRFWPTFRTQGESFHAHANNKPRRESFVPHAGPVPVQNSPDTRPRRAIPVQNSPSTPENADFGPFCASRENFVPLPPPPSRAGRIFYRKRNHLRYKTLPARSPGGPPGTKLSRHAAPSAHPVQNSPSTPKIPLFSAFCASRESFIPRPPPPDQAGRKKSRTGRAKRGGASPYSPRNALIAGISRTAWTRPAR